MSKILRVAALIFGILLASQGESSAYIPIPKAPLWERVFHSTDIFVGKRERHRFINEKGQTLSHWKVLKLLREKDFYWPRVETTLLVSEWLYPAHQRVDKRVIYRHDLPQGYFMAQNDPRIFAEYVSDRRDQVDEPSIYITNKYYDPLRRSWFYASRDYRDEWEDSSERPNVEYWIHHRKHIAGEMNWKGGLLTNVGVWLN